MLRSVFSISFTAVIVISFVYVLVTVLKPVSILPNSPLWLPVLSATVLRLFWYNLEACVSIPEPFFQLSKGNCVSRNSLTLDYLSSTYGFTFLQAFVNGHYPVTIVSVGLHYLDVLIVVIGALAFDIRLLLHDLDQREARSGDLLSTPIRDGYPVSLIVSFAISVVSLMVIAGSASLVYPLRRHAFLPRVPGSIAAVMAFIHNSKMLPDFIDTELLDSNALETKLSTLNKRYALGWFRGRDGQTCILIDEEPMLSRYKHDRTSTSFIADRVSSLRNGILLLGGFPWQ